MRTVVTKAGLLFASLLLPLSNAWAEMVWGSEITIYNSPPAGYVAGGEGIGAVTHTETWSPISPAWYPQSVTASTAAAANAGTLGGSVYGTVDKQCPALCSVSSPGSSVTATLWDTFTIGPGGTFSPGDEVKIHSILAVDGTYSLTGTPSAGSEWSYDVRLSTLQVGYNDLDQIFSQNTGLYPPATGNPSLSWDHEYTLQVGQKVYLWAQLKVAVGSSGFSNDGSGFPWPNGIYTNFLDFTHTGKAGLGYVPGYETISLVSAAGAPIAPAVPVPSAVWLLGSGLVGLLGVARRKAT